MQGMVSVSVSVSRYFEHSCGTRVDVIL